MNFKELLFENSFKKIKIKCPKIVTKNVSISFSVNFIFLRNS